ncbi:MAG TPA: exonuclease subunit SbcD [Actinomycetota bacterium]|nr:exonuclease subunit SbcD [Actinomycetota bacterium]
MRILHTADWHIGKKLGRFDRAAESEAVLDELVAVAQEGDVDLVIVAGDLFDRALPPFASMGLVLETLRRLADTGAQVVAIAGNHDSADLFRVLRPYLEPVGIHLADKARRPEEGGVVRIPARDGSHEAQVALFPFLHEAQAVDFLEAQDEWFKSYADRVRAINAHYAEWMDRNGRGRTTDILVGHFMVDGAVPSGSERALHIGDAFMATRESLPSEVAYTALGHIHQCQEAPGAQTPSWFAGSLMQLDFGEAGQDKFVLMVEAPPGRPARVERVPLSAGRRLLRIEGRLDELRHRASELGDAILDVAVLTDGPVAGLADTVREFLPNALYVRAEYERAAEVASAREGMRLDELYAEYYRGTEGVDPKDDLLEAFRSLVSQVGVDW